MRWRAASCRASQALSAFVLSSFIPSSFVRTQGGHRATIDVRFTPESGHVHRTLACPLWANSGHWSDLFDHLVCTQQKLLRDRQTQRFGSGQIDNEIKLCWLLDRQVGRLSTTQDLVDVFGSASE